MDVAQAQVGTVESQIEAKETEISDFPESLFSQLSDVIGGIVGAVKPLAGGAGALAGSETTSALASDALVGVGAGAGAATAGVGAFAVLGYMSMSSMADAAAARDADLATLRDQALPAAEALVVARQRALQIAQFQQQIAQADVDYLQNLVTFEQHKLLNEHFWVNLAQLSRRLMRRYLELGARAAWLAERALAYEQDRAIDIVRLDYFVGPLQGVTGADLLTADLAELEATRIEGMKRRVPVKRTISLAREFPMAFGQLKATGTCSFATREAMLRSADPGRSGSRERAVSVRTVQADPVNPVRGVLRNQGVSVSDPDGTVQVSVRPSEGLPISEFQLRDDGAVYGLPDETLLTFEGSCFETFWDVVCPLAANPGLDGLFDVVFTFDLQADYDPTRYAADLAAMLKTTRRWLLMSARATRRTAWHTARGLALDRDAGVLIRHRS